MIHFVLCVAGEWALIALAGYAATLSPWWWPLAIVVIGTRQHALAVLGHDGTHHTISRHRGLNDALSLLCFWPLGMGAHGYRRFHFQHHRLVGTPGDPELRHKERFAAKWSADNLAPHRRAYLLVTDLCGAGVLELLTVLRLARPARVSDWIGPPLTVLTLAVLCVAGGAWQAVAVWFLALPTVFWAGFRQRCLEEHVGVVYTRVRLRAPRWWQRLLYLPHHIGKHALHHDLPGWPAWRL